LALLEIVRVLGERQCEGRKLKSIVVVSSAASVRGEKGVAAYAASKGAVNGAVRTLAAELAPEVRVNAVLPGLVRTPMTDHTVKEDGEFDRLARRYPLGLGSAEQVGAVVRELLSPGSRWVTGGCWAVDGGLTAS
jgi:NAD(P)-dependent dehydrogenase (short-subunit alcohol dehydrogenase family)